MAIERKNSSFVVGYESLKQAIERKDNQERVKLSKSLGVDKTKPLQKSKATMALEDSERFRTMKDHFVPIEELVSLLESDLTLGLTEDIARKKFITHGPNKLSEQTGVP